MAGSPRETPTGNPALDPVLDPLRPSARSVGDITDHCVDCRNTARNRRLALAGTQFAQAVKDEGWKRAPAVAWRSFLHGRGIKASE